MSENRPPLQTTEPSIPRSGIMYGRIGFVIALTGTAISLIGLIWYLSTGGDILNAKAALPALLSGSKPSEIWAAAGQEFRTGHWYFRQLTTPDGLAMLGIAISCTGAVWAMWSAFITKLICGEARQRKAYPVFVALILIMAVLLTCSALGAAGK